MPLAKDRKQITINSAAYKHLKRLQAARKRIGQPHNYTAIASELILAQPIPNGSGPLPAAEVRQINKEARP